MLLIKFGWQPQQEVATPVQAVKKGRGRPRTGECMFIISELKVEKKLKVIKITNF